MSKRFADTSLWEKEWFMKLPPAEKLAFIYIKDRCDTVGLWSPNFELANTLIGTCPDWETLPERCNNNIEVLATSGKWFLPDFCEFQYGELKESCKPHQSYIRTLKKYGLLEKIKKKKIKGIDTLKEKEQAKEKDKNNKKKKKEIYPAIEMSQEQYEILFKDYGKQITKDAIEKLSDYKQSSGKKYKSDYHTILNWVIDEVTGKDRKLVKADRLREKERAEKQKKIKQEIETGKLEQRLTPAETKEFIKGIYK